MRILSRVIFCALAVLGIVYFVNWIDSPEKPRELHDPFGVGYPDSSSKPEELRKAEEIVAENWPFVRSMFRDNPLSWVRGEVEKELARPGYTRSFSSSEIDKYARVRWALAFFSTTIRKHRSDGKITDSEMDELISALHRYLVDDYVQGQLGMDLSRYPKSN